MKNKIVRPLRVLLVLLGIGAASVQTCTAQAFNVGDNVASVGIGFGGHYSVFSSHTTQSPAIGLGYEKATAIPVGPGVLGMGGYLGFKTIAHKRKVNYGFGSNYDEDWRYTYYILGFRAAYHYNAWHNSSQLDTYAGVMLSYNALSYRDNSKYPDGSGFSYTGTSSGNIGLSPFVGIRYYFGPTVGAFAELGYGISYGTIGLAFKF